MAQITLKAIGKFATAGNPAFIKSVHIAIFDSQTFEVYKKELTKDSSSGILDKFKGTYIFIFENPQMYDCE